MSKTKKSTHPFYGPDEAFCIERGAVGDNGHEEPDQVLYVRNASKLEREQATSAVKQPWVAEVSRGSMYLSSTEKMCLFGIHPLTGKPACIPIDSLHQVVLGSDVHKLAEEAERRAALAKLTPREIKLLGIKSKS